MHKFWLSRVGVRGRGILCLMVLTFCIRAIEPAPSRCWVYSIAYCMESIAVGLYASCEPWNALMLLQLNPRSSEGQQQQPAYISEMKGRNSQPFFWHVNSLVLLLCFFVKATTQFNEYYLLWYGPV